MPTTIRVALQERSYDIAIGRGNMAAAGDFLRHRLKATHAVIITDTNVRSLFATPIEKSLTSAGVRCDVLTVPAGEESKSIVQAEKLWNELVGRGADRKTVVVAVGGGVVGDLAGFVAATFGRGLAFVQVPTTLLAQVDSSVGGKVGINLASAKNMVGAFWQPAGVLIDLDALTTLPDREYRAGLAEVVKYGVILDADFFTYLEMHVGEIEARHPTVLEHLVARSCQLKAEVVQQDEREETGLRAVLNYGHTFCHAIETVTGYGKYLHGEAVAIGMTCAAKLAKSLGRVDVEFVQRQQSLLEALRLPVAVHGLDNAALLAAMHRDKKAEHGRLRFVLPLRMGHVEVVGDIDEGTVRHCLDEVSQ